MSVNPLLAAEASQPWPTTAQRDAAAAESKLKGVIWAAGATTGHASWLARTVIAGSDVFVHCRQRETAARVYDALCLNARGPAAAAHLNRPEAVSVAVWTAMGARGPEDAASCLELYVKAARTAALAAAGENFAAAEAAIEASAAAAQRARSVGSSERIATVSNGGTCANDAHPQSAAAVTTTKNTFCSGETAELAAGAHVASLRTSAANAAGRSPLLGIFETQLGVDAQNYVPDGKGHVNLSTSFSSMDKAAVSIKLAGFAALGTGFSAHGSYPLRRDELFSLARVKDTAVCLSRSLRRRGARVVFTAAEATTAAACGPTFVPASSAASEFTFGASTTLPRRRLNSEAVSATAVAAAAAVSTDDMDMDDDRVREVVWGFSPSAESMQMPALQSVSCSLSQRGQPLRAMAAPGAFSAAASVPTRVYRGVLAKTPRGPWESFIYFLGSRLSVGTYPSALQAARAHDRLLLRLCGRVQSLPGLNFPDEVDNFAPYAQNDLVALQGSSDSDHDMYTTLVDGGRRRFVLSLPMSPLPPPLRLPAMLPPWVIEDDSEAVCVIGIKRPREEGLSDDNTGVGDRDGMRGIAEVSPVAISVAPLLPRSSPPLLPLNDGLRAASSSASPAPISTSPFRDLRVAVSTAEPPSYMLAQAIAVPSFAVNLPAPSSSSPSQVAAPIVLLSSVAPSTVKSSSALTKGAFLQPASSTTPSLTVSASFEAVNSEAASSLILQTNRLCAAAQLRTARVQPNVISSISNEQAAQLPPIVAKTALALCLAAPLHGATKAVPSEGAQLPAPASKKAAPSELVPAQALPPAVREPAMPSSPPVLIQALSQVPSFHATSATGPAAGVGLASRESTFAYQSLRDIAQPLLTEVTSCTTVVGSTLARLAEARLNLCALIKAECGSQELARMLHRFCDEVPVRCTGDADNEIFAELGGGGSEVAAANASVATLLEYALGELTSAYGVACAATTRNAVAMSAAALLCHN